MTDEINEISSTTPDFHSELARQLEELVPEAIADGKVDIAKLKELLGDDVQDESERFGLFWPGKKRALRTSQEPTTATLRPDRENSRDWVTTQNIFIEGDNLEVLKILQRHYHSKIDMIYIDPPYNTGKDFVYPDNYKEGLESYLVWTRQVNEEGKTLSSNSETEGRYHSNWLNMMYPRLKLARNLLSDDGVILISIDDHELENLIRLCKEIFGDSNHINTFVWVSNLKGRQISSSGAAGTKEYVVVFARNSLAVAEFRASATDLKSMMPAIYKGFDYKVLRDERGPYVIKNELYNTNSAFNELTRPNLVFDIYFNPETGEVLTEALSEQHLHQQHVKISPHKNSNGVNKFHAWRWSQRKVLEESYDLEFSENEGVWRVHTKVRDVDSTSVKDLIMGITTSEGSAEIEKIGLDPSWFDYPKPVNLIKLFVETVSKKDSIILDFFAGSGTTAQAVMQRNHEDGGSRKYIQVQLPEPLKDDSKARSDGLRTIADISRKRILAAAEKFEVSQSAISTNRTVFDFGFRAYKLAETNFEKWRVTSDITPDKLERTLLDMRQNTDDKANPEDILTELLLKLGFSLCETILETSIAGLDCFCVGEGELIAYLDERRKPTVEQLRSIIDLHPVKFIFLEDAFQGDDELKTNLKQICKTNDIELWTA